MRTATTRYYSGTNRTPDWILAHGLGGAISCIYGIPSEHPFLYHEIRMKRRAVGIGFAITVLAALLLILPSAAGESLPATAVGKAASQFDSDRDARIDLPAELHTAAWRRGIGHG